MVPNERTSGSVRVNIVNISQGTEKGRKMEDRGQGVIKPWETKAIVIVQD